MAAAVLGAGSTPGETGEDGGRTVDEDKAPSSADDNAAGSDGGREEGEEEEDEEEEEEEEEEENKICPSLRMDHRHQRALFQIGDEVEAEEAALDDQSLSQNLRKFAGDLCGWVPDPGARYRRPAAAAAAGKSAPKAGRIGGNPRSESSRRSTTIGRHPYGHTAMHAQQQQPAINFEFKHFGNYKKYSEQYRRFHTCGGPLQKLTQSAYGGRSRTIYYAGQATTEAGVNLGGASAPAGPARPGGGHGSAIRGPRVVVAEKPSSSSQPIVSYSDISVNSPRFNLLADNSHQRGRAQRPGQYPRVEWTHNPDGAHPSSGYEYHPSAGGDRPPTVGNNAVPGQWNISTNDQTLTVFTSKPPGTLPAQRRSESPPKPHLPFFPSQQPLKQLSHAGRTTALTPPASSTKPISDPMPNGYSLDKTLGTKVGSSIGISRNPEPHRDFYSQLMHAAHCLTLAAKSPKDFDFQLPNWPIFTSHPEPRHSTSSRQHPPRPEKPAQRPPHPRSPSSISAAAANVQVQMKGQRLGTSPQLSQQQQQQSRNSPASSNERSATSRNPTSRQSADHVASTSDTPTSDPPPTLGPRETHYITIEAPPVGRSSSSSFETRSGAAHSRRESEGEGAQPKRSYRVTLKEKPAAVPDLKEKAAMDLVGDANRPLAVCEVAWF